MLAETAKRSRVVPEPRVWQREHRHIVLSPTQSALSQTPSAQEQEAAGGPMETEREPLQLHLRACTLSRLTPMEMLELFCRPRLEFNSAGFKVSITPLVSPVVQVTQIGRDTEIGSDRPQSSESYQLECVCTRLPR